ncbi:helix-turn-helix domain-containing protein [Paenibacillus sp. RRE4]|uniref:winged helix-turn-helix transcriptional regulator n=1 Tax=Paenibacillus sp. RRE4 TaxID=2962587 RepID=UPI002882B319|nr:helix-turn-helix domain-containing protein [Paenibacillus sp. RRE4]MDT0124809.1 helix-turn-helix domain-containing protein [Paenibacillus sp. RRE4]
MTKHMNTSPPKALAPFDYTLSIIGGKWKMKIMYQLAFHGVTRYGELKRRVPGITYKVLTTQLNDLEREGVIQRVEYDQIPPKVEYSLTLRGQSLMPILEEICKWGVHNVPDAQMIREQ